MALQRHPPIIALHVCPQWISAYDLLENGGFFAVQEVGREVWVNEQMFVSVMGQLEFISEKLVTDYPNVSPANHFAQDLHQGAFTPPT